MDSTILETSTIQTSISIPLVNTHKLEIKQWLKKPMWPNNQWHRSIQWAQLVSSHHQRIGNMMFHTRCWSHLSKKTEMDSTILETSTIQTSISIPLENTHKLEIKQWLKKPIWLNNQWHRSIQWAQLDLSHHQKTGSMMFHTKCWSHLSKKTEMDSTISETSTIQTSISIPLVNTHKLETKPWLKKQMWPNNQWLRLIQWAQLVSSHHQRIGNMMFHTKCWNQSFRKIEMDLMTSLMSTTQINISIRLENMLKLETKLCHNPTKLWKP